MDCKGQRCFVSGSKVTLEPVGVHDPGRVRERPRRLREMTVPEKVQAMFARFGLTVDDVKNALKDQ